MAATGNESSKERQGQHRPADRDIELALAQSEGPVEFEPRDTDGGPHAAPPGERQHLIQGPSSSGRGSSSSAPPHISSSMHSRRWAPWQVVGGGILLVILLLVMLAAIAAVGGGARPPDNPTYARFQIIGDWGRNGLHNQSEVASVMGAVAHDDRPDFIISTGDNFYQSGLTSTTDDQFRTSFTDVYATPSLKSIPWHAVLGNHDYGERQHGWAIQPTCPPVTPNCSYSPLHELDVGLRQRDKRWHCTRAGQMSLGDNKVDVFFYDTSPFIEKYQNTSWSGLVGGILQQSWQANLAELESGLASSVAEWKIVIGHHPVLSSGGNYAHGKIVELPTHVQPILEKYGVQVYFNGHDHHLEHLRSPGRQYPHYIISGAGSKVSPVKSNVGASIFKYHGSGFVEAVLKAEQLDLRFFGILDEKHRPVYSVSIPRVAAPKSGRRLLLEL